MNFLQRIKERFSLRRIKNLGKQSRGHDFVDIDNAQKVGIIVNVNLFTPEDHKNLREYISKLRDLGKELLIVELNFKKKSDPRLQYAGGNYIFINPSKLNWLDYPNPSVESELKRFELDILMDFDHSGYMTSKYLCGLLNAKTRTGMHREGYEGCYELMIAPSGGLEMGKLIKEFDYFLHMIEKEPQAVS